jgi:hypothetical protein
MQKLSESERSTVLAALAYFADSDLDKSQVEDIFTDEELLDENQITELSNRIEVEEETPFDRTEAITIIGALRFLQGHYSHAVSPTQKYHILPSDDINILCENLNFSEFY